MQIAFMLIFCCTTYMIKTEAKILIYFQDSGLSENCSMSLCRLCVILIEAILGCTRSFLTIVMLHWSRSLKLSLTNRNLWKAFWTKWVNTYILIWKIKFIINTNIFIYIVYYHLIYPQFPYENIKYLFLFLSLPVHKLYNSSYYSKFFFLYTIYTLS